MWTVRITPAGDPETILGDACLDSLGEATAWLQDAGQELLFYRLTDEEPGRFLHIEIDEVLA